MVGNFRKNYGRGSLLAKPWVCVMAGFLGLMSPVTAQTVITFNDFSDVSTLQINGNAAAVSSRLRITDNITNQAGSFFLTNPITLGSQSDFSSYFTFQITNSVAGGAMG